MERKKDVGALIARAIIPGLDTVAPGLGAIAEAYRGRITNTDILLKKSRFSDEKKQAIQKIAYTVLLRRAKRGDYDNTLLRRLGEIDVTRAEIALGLRETTTSTQDIAQVFTETERVTEEENNRRVQHMQDLLACTDIPLDEYLLPEDAARVEQLRTSMQNIRADKTEYHLSSRPAWSPHPEVGVTTREEQLDYFMAGLLLKFKKFSQLPANTLYDLTVETINHIATADGTVLGEVVYHFGVAANKLIADLREQQQQ